MQNQNWGIIVQNTKFNVSPGRCLQQLFGTHISYKYDKINSIFFIGKQNEYNNQQQLLHGLNCPCYNKNIQQIDKTIKIAVVGMVCDLDNYFLLTKRSSKLKAFPNAWVFPGGMVEKQQDLEEECFREIYEETGIDTKFALDTIQLKLFYESIYPTILEENQLPQKQTLCLFYEVKLQQSHKQYNVKIQESEVSEYQWIKKNELIDICQGKQIQQFEQIIGIYPNQYNSGIGEGHQLSFLYSYK